MFYSVVYIMTLNTAKNGCRPTSRYEIDTAYMRVDTVKSVQIRCFVLRLSAVSRGLGHVRDRLSTSGSPRPMWTRRLKRTHMPLSDGDRWKFGSFGIYYRKEHPTAA